MELKPKVIGQCECGCGEPVYERYYLKRDGYVRKRRFRYVHGHRHRAGDQTTLTRPKQKTLVYTPPYAERVISYKRAAGLTWPQLSKLLGEHPSWLASIGKQQWMTRKRAARIDFLLSSRLPAKPLCRLLSERMRIEGWTRWEMALCLGLAEPELDGIFRQPLVDRFLADSVVRRLAGVTHHPTAAERRRAVG